MLKEAKKALRVTVDNFDDEIMRLCMAGYDDLKIAGVIETLKDNKNIKYSTLEVGGSAELLRASAKYIEDRWNA